MSMKKNLKYLLLLSLLSFMACNGDEKIDSGMVQPRFFHLKQFL